MIPLLLLFIPIFANADYYSRNDRRLPQFNEDTYYGRTQRQFNPHDHRSYSTWPLSGEPSMVVNGSGVFINGRKFTDSSTVTIDNWGRRSVRGVNPCIINVGSKSKFPNFQNGIVEDCGVKRAETAEDRRMLSEYQEAIKQWHRDMNPPRKPRPKYPKFPPICRKDCNMQG